MTVSQKITNRINIGFSSSTSGYITERTESRVSEILIYGVHSSIAHNSQKVKQPKHTLMAAGYIHDIMWYTQTSCMEYYSASKRKRILTCTTKCMKLEDNMLSDSSSQSQNDRYYITSLI